VSDRRETFEADPLADGRGPLLVLDLGAPRAAARALSGFEDD
jgi:hypothetical protein